MSECVEVFVGMTFLCEHFEEYGILFTRKPSTSMEDETLQLKIKVVEKVIEHFVDEKHSASPVRVDGVIGTHSRILSFLDNLEKLSSVLLEEAGMFIKEGAEELKEITSIKQVYDKATVVLKFHANEEFNLSDTESNATDASGDTLILSDNE